LEVFEEDDFFMSSRLAKRDHADFRFTLGVHDRNGNISSETELTKRFSG